MSISQTDMVDFFVPEQFSSLQSFTDFSALTSNAFSEMVLHLMESSGVVRDEKGFLHASRHSHAKDVQFPEYSFLVRCIRQGTKKEVNDEDIEKFHQDIDQQGLSAGIFLSTAPFTQSSRDIAKKYNILCIGKSALGVMMRKINNEFEEILENEEDIFSYLYNFTEEYKVKRNIFYQDISTILSADIGEILFDTNYSVSISPENGVIFSKSHKKDKKYKSFFHLGLFLGLITFIFIGIILTRDPMISQTIMASILGQQ